MIFNDIFSEMTSQNEDEVQAMVKDEDDDDDTVGDDDVILKQGCLKWLQQLQAAEIQVSE